MKKFLIVLMFLVLAVNVFATGEGEGTATILPATVIEGESGIDAVITFVAGAEAYSNGYLYFYPPAGWTAPSVTSTEAGYVTATSSQDGLVITTDCVSVTIAVSALDAAGTITLHYGDTSGGGAGSTAPGSAETSVFNLYSDPDGGGSESTIASPPEIEVLAPTETITATTTPTTTPTITATITATITPITVKIDSYKSYVSTANGAGFEVLWDNSCYLVGWEINKTDCNATGDTINVYNASTAAEFVASNYSFPIGIQDCTRLPIGSPIYNLYGLRNNNKYYRYFSNGLGVSKSATGIESTFYIYDK